MTIQGFQPHILKIKKKLKDQYIKSLSNIKKLGINLKKTLYFAQDFVLMIKNLLPNYTNKND